MAVANCEFFTRFHAKDTRYMRRIPSCYSKIFAEKTTFRRFFHKKSWHTLLPYRRDYGGILFYHFLQ
jgi:hypothetical protein